MKTMLKSVSLLAAAITLAACQPQDSGTTEEEVALDTSQARLSYGVALGLGRNMANDGLAVDVDAFALGLRDALSGAEQRLTEEEIRDEMLAFQERITAERQAQQSAVAEANAQAGTAFLTTNAAREGVVTTESGLQYEVLEAGDGAMPGPTDQVQVHYRGTLVDGTEFDSSYSRGQPLTFGVNQVIPGWTEGLQLMSVGSKYKLVIPSELGYGAAGSGQIPPNAALVFEVELLGIPSQQGDSEEG
jgi:FKBP-type peptidyl-prolyl cis-trans isomerase